MVKEGFNVGCPAQHWGVGEYGRLTMCNEWVFGDKDGQLLGLNSFVSKVVLNNLVSSMYVKRVKKDGNI